MVCFILPVQNLVRKLNDMDCACHGDLCALTSVHTRSQTFLALSVDDRNEILVYDTVTGKQCETLTGLPSPALYLQVTLSLLFVIYTN